MNQTPTGPGYAPCALFQVRPNPLTECDSARSQTAHPGGIVVGLADGSVRTVAAGVTPDTWAKACDPRDGSPLGADW